MSLPNCLREGLSRSKSIGAAAMATGVGRGSGDAGFSAFAGEAAKPVASASAMAAK
jgi:hypothetical protein